LEQSYRTSKSCVGTAFCRFGPLADGLVGDGAVICPLHERIFDLASGNCKNADCRIKAYPVSLTQDQEIVLNLDTL
jgi:nitrite reductase (NADH) small subunit